MNYETEDYNSQRITPVKELKCPLSILDKIEEKFTPPVISNGIVYKVKARHYIGAYSEKNLSLLNTNESEPFIVGCFAFNRDECG